MKKQNLILYNGGSDLWRTVIKTKHNRLIYLSLKRVGQRLVVKDCYYVDRIRGGAYYASPQKLTTRDFSYNEMLDIIASELDRRYFGIEITDKFATLTTTEFINLQLKTLQRKYNFLIFIGEGDLINGIPSVIKTRFKNRVHRGIYLEMQYRDGKGVITDCHYCDRKYKERSKVVPETLSTVFFEYNRQAILQTVNNELNTAFTHIIFVTDGSLDIGNKVALCGNI